MVMNNDDDAWDVKNIKIKFMPYNPYESFPFLSNKCSATCVASFV